MADFEPRVIEQKAKPYYVQKFDGVVWQNCIFDFDTWDAANHTLDRISKRIGIPRHHYRIRKRHV